MDDGKLGGKGELKYMNVQENVNTNYYDVTTIYNTNLGKPFI